MQVRSVDLAAMRRFLEQEVDPDMSQELVSTTDWIKEEGREEGREEGLLAGKIQLIQQLLGEESISTESLLNRSTEELSSMLSDLQERLRSRGDQDPNLL